MSHPNLGADHLRGAAAGAAVDCPSLLLAADQHPGVITIASLWGGLWKFADTPSMWRLSKVDTVVWWVTMLASSLILTDIGLLVGVCFAFLCIIVRIQRPRATLLGKVNDTEIYEDQLQAAQQYIQCQDLQVQFLPLLPQQELLQELALPENWGKSCHGGCQTT
ncbi:unnamed protein product [Eretmochelys imbricata]